VKAAFNISPSAGDDHESEIFVADGAAGATRHGAEKQKNLPPMNAEYTEIRRKEFYSATLGDFGCALRAKFGRYFSRLLVALACVGLWQGRLVRMGCAHLLASKFTLTFPSIPMLPPGNILPPIY
jgi:hypothetical protein